MSSFALIASLPTELVLMGALMTVLPMRARPLFAVAFISLTVASWAVFDFIVVRLLLHTVLGIVVLPFLLYDAHANKKILAVTLLFIAFFIGETLSNGVIVLLGASVPWFADAGDGWRAVLGGRAVSVVWLVVAGALVQKLLKDMGGPAARGGIRRFALVPGLQMALLLVVYVTIWPYWETLATSAPFHGTISLVLVVCFVVDVLLFDRIERYAAFQAASERARSLQGSLSRFLDRYASMLEDVEATSRARHDIRNHLQVIDMLVERGQTDIALEYVRRTIGDLLEIRPPRPVPPPDDETDAAPEHGAFDGGGPFARLRGGALILYPLSQVGILAWGCWVTVAFSLPPETLLPIAAVGAACVPYNVVLWASLSESNNKELAELHARTLEEQVVTQRRHLEEFQRGIEEAVEAYRSMVDGLRRIEDALRRGDLDAARAGLGDTARSVRGGRIARYCENPVVDSLFAVKMPACDDLGIETFLNLDVPAGIGIEPQALCGVFANLFDNALNALGAMQGVRRCLWVVAAVRAGHLLVEFSNTCEPQGAGPRRKGRGFDEHGWGLAIVEAIAKRNGGSLDVDVSGGVFSVTVVMRPCAYEGG